MEFRDRIERHLEDGFDLARLRALYFERLEPNREMIDFIRELRGRGLRAALLTNNVREWEPLWRAKLPEIDELFEVVVDSAFVGLRKPDPAIYDAHARAARRRRSPEDCVFVDDLDVNCEAARALGMAAVRFVDAGAGDPGDRVSLGFLRNERGLSNRVLDGTEEPCSTRSAETRTQAQRAKPRGCEARRAAPETSVTGSALLKR